MSLSNEMIQNADEKPQTSDQSSNHKNPKRKKRYLFIGVVVIIGVVLIAILIGWGLLSSQEFHFTGYRYTVVYTIHSPEGPSTITKLIVNETWRATYDLGRPFILNQPFYNNQSGGITKVSNITCETPGFSFVESSLPFPFSVPTALNASVTNNNIMVQLTFTTPSTPYEGPFIYTVYFDYYP
jgi:hypothetical protein